MKESWSFCLSLSSLGGERERERRRKWQTGIKEVKHSLSLSIYIYIKSFWSFFKFLVFVILIGRPFGVWIFKKERPLGFRHHESLRSWKQVLHPSFSPFLPFHLFILDSVFLCICFFFKIKNSFYVFLFYPLRMSWDFDVEVALDLFLDEFLSPLFDLSVFLICLLHNCLLCSVEWDG